MKIEDLLWILWKWVYVLNMMIVICWFLLIWVVYYVIMLCWVNFLDLSCWKSFGLLRLILWMRYCKRLLSFFVCVIWYLVRFMYWMLDCDIWLFVYFFLSFILMVCGLLRKVWRCLMKSFLNFLLFFSDFLISYFFLVLMELECWNWFYKFRFVSFSGW